MSKGSAQIDNEGLIAVVGLGYVGLPLAVKFSAVRKVLGFDTDPKRIEDLKSGIDRTREVSAGELKRATGLLFTSSHEKLSAAKIFIVTVPTPIDAHKQPDLGPLRKASEIVGSVIRRGALVVYESTVYPGCTEEECVPIIEDISGLKMNQDFYAGYSPERINPGDKQHTLTNIVKVTSGSCPLASRAVDELYASIITAGTHRAKSIKVAEAAKVIENTQRDLNIAFINELAMIFHRLDIDTEAVLQAAETKWNFLSFRPGLVGGHCIGVDPYYLTHKAQALGYHPEVILAGRRVNDSMPTYVASQVVKAMVRKKIQIQGSKVLVMGLTFKENCPDLRNTKVLDLISDLADYGCAVDVCDPWIDQDEVKRQCCLSVVSSPEMMAYDAVILAVAHDQFQKAGLKKIKSYAKNASVICDLKHIFNAADVDLRL